MKRAIGMGAPVSGLTAHPSTPLPRAASTVFHTSHGPIVASRLTLPGGRGKRRFGSLMLERVSRVIRSWGTV
jgi:hypothetical protein